MSIKNELKENIYELFEVYDVKVSDENKECMVKDIMIMIDIYTNYKIRNK